jgi:hypothetical protein
MDPRGTVDLVGHSVMAVDGIDPSVIPKFENIIVQPQSPKGVWLEQSMYQIGDWRNTFRSTYLHWALAINGLHVAAERYGRPDWPASQQFTVSSLTAGPEGRAIPSVLVRWDGQTASRAHIDTTRKMAAWGIVELYANLEEFVFALYRIYLSAHPKVLMQGEHYRDLRKLHKVSVRSPEDKAAWATAWSRRLESWQRKRLYDGLGPVLISYMREANLQKPKAFTKSDPSSWAETIRIIAILRNALVHGAKTVPDELAQAASAPNNAGLRFDKETPLLVGTGHLQAIQLFTDQLLSALNLSMIEHPDVLATE